MRALPQQIFGNTKRQEITPGPASTRTVGQVVDVSFDWPRVWVLYLRTEGLDRIAGDTGSLALRVRIGSGFSQSEELVLDPNGFTLGPIILPASTVQITGELQNVVVVAPRLLVFAAYAAPWTYEGPETQGSTPFPLNRTDGTGIPR